MLHLVRRTHSSIFCTFHAYANFRYEYFISIKSSVSVKTEVACPFGCIVLWYLTAFYLFIRDESISTYQFEFLFHSCLIHRSTVCTRNLIFIRCLRNIATWFAIYKLFSIRFEYFIGFMQHTGYIRMDSRCISAFWINFRQNLSKKILENCKFWL